MRELGLVRDERKNRENQKKHGVSSRRLAFAKANDSLGRRVARWNLAEAIVDRVLERDRFIEPRGTSYETQRPGPPAGGSEPRCVGS